MAGIYSDCSTREIIITATVDVPRWDRSCPTATVTLPPLFSITGGYKLTWCNQTLVIRGSLFQTLGKFVWHPGFLSEVTPALTHRPD